MEHFSFIFTVLFMLLGPLKIIPAFTGLMHGADFRFQRDVAIRAAVIAAALCAFVALVGVTLLHKYRISLDALRISGGLVLLISALQGIFKKAQPSAPGAGTPTAMQLAVSPVAVPIIVPPAGVAFILVFMMQTAQYPGMAKVVALSLAIVMGLNFLTMYFIDRIIKTPGLPILLGVLGSVLVFVQACLAMEIILIALKSLGLFHG